MRAFIFRQSAWLVFVCLAPSNAHALSIREYRKHSPEQQAVYVSAAVSMLAYNYAANGEVAKATCVKTWYFGVMGQETPGPRQLAVELVAMEKLDPDKYHVEGVILGAVSKACK